METSFRFRVGAWMMDVGRRLTGPARSQALLSVLSENDESVLSGYALVGILTEGMHANLDNHEAYMDMYYSRKEVLAAIKMVNDAEPEHETRVGASDASFDRRV